MEKLSISEIMWNLSSGFREISFKDAELVLIKREHQLKADKVRAEEKHDGILKENEALKNNCGRLRKKIKMNGLLRRRLSEKLQAMESENSRLLLKIKGLEEDKAEAQRRERDVKPEIEKHSLEIACLEKDEAAENLDNINNRFDKNIDSLMEDSILSM